MKYIDRQYESMNLSRHSNAKQVNRHISGFTIVELLIVIVVIGILAAISIVAYNGIQDRANDTAIKNDLTQMAKKVSLYNAEEGSYPGWHWFFNNIDISKESYSTSTYNFYYCTNPTYTGFGIAIMSKSEQVYTISSARGITSTAHHPSLNSACGAMGQDAFGETWSNPYYKPSSSDTSFSYGYDYDEPSWNFGL